MTQFTLSAFADEASPEFDRQIAALHRKHISLMEIRGVDGKGILDLTDEELDVVEKKLVEIAKKLHTTRIRMFSFYIPEGKNPEIYHDTVIERIQKMVDYGEANGVHCCHENEKGIYGDTLKRVEKLHKAIPALRCVFDPANYIQCGDDPAVNFKALAPIIDYMHIKDALFKDGSVVPAGEGDGSVPSILKTLAETGKPYMLTLEPHLYDFSGLQNLQGEDVLHKRVYKDADEAFDVASDALHDILKTIE